MHVLAATVFVVEFDFAVRFDIFNFRQRSILGHKRLGVLAILVFDHFEPIDRLNSIFDFVIQLLRNLLNRVLGDAGAKAHQHFGLTIVALIVTVDFFAFV